LALLAGVAPDAVTVDNDKNRAVVRATPLPAAGLATYRALETRLAEARTGWTIQLIPPPLALPPVEMAGDAPDTAAADAYALTLWAAQRIGLPVDVGGAGGAELVSLLQAAGVDARPDPAAASTGPATARWRTATPAG